MAEEPALNWKNGLPDANMEKDRHKKENHRGRGHY